MTEKSDRWIELLRYPLVVFSLLLAAWMGQCTMGIDFGRIASIGTQGISFREADEASEQAVVQLETRVNELEAALAALQAESGSGDSSALRLDAASQTVSDQIARATQLRREQTGSAPARGYIFIGNWSARGWDPAVLLEPATLDTTTLSPDAIRPRTTWAVRENMALRGARPDEGGDYYKSVPQIGVVPAYTRIRLLGAPLAYDRGFATQYWVEVEVLEEGR